MMGVGLDMKSKDQFKVNNEDTRFKKANKLTKKSKIKKHNEVGRKVQEQAKKLSKTKEKLKTEIKRRKQLEKELIEKERIINGIRYNSPSSQFVIDKDHRIVYWNHAIEKLTNIKAEEILGTKNQWKPFYDYERPCMVDFIVDGNIEEISKWYSRKNKRSKFVLRYQGKYESKSLGDSCDAVDFFPMVGEKGKWLHFTASAIRNPEGDIIGGIETIDNINDQIRAQDELRKSMVKNEIILREIHKVVKNNLRIMKGIINYQSQQITDENIFDMYKENQNRVKSVILIHEKFYQSQDPAWIDFEDYVKSLITDLFNSHGIDKNLIMVDIDIKNVLFNLNTAIPCGLIVNELITNSIKHGFTELKSQKSINGLFPEFDRVDNEIAVKITKKEEYYIMNIYDNGVGFPEDLNFQKTNTLGMQLVISLINRLRGTIELEREKGTLFKITFKDLENDELHF